MIYSLIFSRSKMAVSLTSEVDGKLAPDNVGSKILHANSSSKTN
jgi:hypothetical protein